MRFPGLPGKACCCPALFRSDCPAPSCWENCLNACEFAELSQPPAHSFPTAVVCVLRQLIYGLAHCLVSGPKQPPPLGSCHANCLRFYRNNLVLLVSSVIFLQFYVLFSALVLVLVGRFLCFFLFAFPSLFPRFFNIFPFCFYFLLRLALGGISHWLCRRTCFISYSGFICPPPYLINNSLIFSIDLSPSPEFVNGQRVSFQSQSQSPIPELYVWDILSRKWNIRRLVCLSQPLKVGQVSLGKLFKCFG